MAEKIARILLADDEESIRLMLKKLLTKNGYEVCTYEDGEALLEAAKSIEADLIISDLKMPGKGGLEVLEGLQACGIETFVIVMTAHATIETAVTAMKRGAYDYITKPFELEDFLLLVERTLAVQRLKAKNDYLGSDSKFMADLIGQSPKMIELKNFIYRIAPTDAKVLILGESGTGKEIVARSIHFASNRASGPYVKVNCAALPETLLESELFGHEKGSFTGAVGRKLGRFELANKGTIFLDEIGEITLATQVKLLRVLQEQEFERVGGTATIKLDVRIIAATNRDLEQEVAEGRFREDLYYRLNVLSLYLPSLRERKEDLDSLVKHFLDKFNLAMGKNIKQFSPAAWAIMQEYDWPGNVRELENAIERVVILSHGSTVLEETLPRPLLRSRQRVQNIGAKFKPVSLRQVEKDLILRTLEETAGNRTKAAKILGISLRTLQYKLKEYQEENMAN